MGYYCELRRIEFYFNISKLLKIQRIGYGNMNQSLQSEKMS